MQIIIHFRELYRLTNKNLFRLIVHSLELYLSEIFAQLKWIMVKIKLHFNS